MSKRKNPGYEVGYGKPPRHAQFKPGTSGNPKGRPKGAKNIDTIMQEALFRPIQITQNGRKVTVAAIEALFMRMMKEGLGGDARSIANILKIATLQQGVQRQSAGAVGGDAASGQADRPLEEVDREVLKHFADLLRDGGLDLGEDDEGAA